MSRWNVFSDDDVPVGTDDAVDDTIDSWRAPNSNGEMGSLNVFWARGGDMGEWSELDVGEPAAVPWPVCL